MLHAWRAATGVCYNSSVRHSVPPADTASFSRMNCPACQADNAPGVEVCFTCGAPLSAIRQGSVVANRYEVRRLIGKGGMGTVYEATTAGWTKPWPSRS